MFSYSYSSQFDKRCNEQRFFFNILFMSKIRLTLGNKQLFALYFDQMKSHGFGIVRVYRCALLIAGNTTSSY